MPMKPETVKRKLEILTDLLDRKERGIPLSPYYDHVEFFAHRLEWMYKFKHIDKETFDKYCARVLKVYEIE